MLKVHYLQAWFPPRPWHLISFTGPKHGTWKYISLKLSCKKVHEGAQSSRQQGVVGDI